MVGLKHPDRSNPCLMGKSCIGLLEDKIYTIESIFFAHENWAFLQPPKQSHTSAI
jgi:hypothetical protein